VLTVNTEPLFMQSTQSKSSQHAFWQPHAIAWQASGLSKARYCREHELNYHQFIYWLPRFVSDAPSVPTKAKASKLLPVAIKQHVGSGLRITLPSGVIIDGVTQESVQLLGAVVTQL
jgi:hypothetical protein